MPARAKSGAGRGSAAPAPSQSRQDQPAAVPDRLDHRLGRLGRVGDGGRAVEHQHRVGVGVGQHGVERGAVAAGRGVADDVDRVAVRPGGRQGGVERGQRLGDSSASVPPAVHQGVGRHHAGAAAVGQDREPLARLRPGAPPPAPGSRPRRTVLGGVVHAQHAGAAEGGVVDRVRRRPARRCASARPARAGGVRPDLTTSTGLVRAAARAADMNLRALVTPST
jgi:hypothetical protein